MDHQMNEMSIEFMEAAVGQAKKSYSEGGLPIGSVLANTTKILSSGHNRREQHQDPIAHAELDCLRAAGLLDPQTYAKSVLYSTLSPCWMCAGAIRLYGIKTIIVADSGQDIPGQERWRADEEFYRAAGVEYLESRHEEMIAIFRDFLHSSPEKWWGDVGDSPNTV